MKTQTIRPDDRNHFKPSLHLEDFDDGFSIISPCGYTRIRVGDNGKFFAETKLFWWWVSVDVMNCMGNSGPLVFEDALDAEYWLRFGKMLQPVNMYHPE